ncbi:hypothetical protein HAX54_029431 [Datura stramonium]|uniref:Uncharacterized protein n=1 Tax=Datura stramonium TaxID=4076 RepID=A0ABS8V759_DATST|nr:hypothetical protein [Datura stramonium]
MRGEGSKADNFYNRRPRLLQLVSESVPCRWWGKPDGGANLIEDAESQGGTHFKTVRGEGSKADNFYKRRPRLLQLVSEPVSGRWWGKPDGGANLSEDVESQRGVSVRLALGESHIGLGESHIGSGGERRVLYKC